MNIFNVWPSPSSSSFPSTTRRCLYIDWNSSMMSDSTPESLFVVSDFASLFVNATLFELQSSSRLRSSGDGAVKSFIVLLRFAEGLTVLDLTIWSSFATVNFGLNEVCFLLIADLSWYTAKSLNLMAFLGDISGNLSEFDWLSSKYSKSSSYIFWRYLFNYANKSMFYASFTSFYLYCVILFF